MTLAASGSGPTALALTLGAVILIAGVLVATNKRFRWRLAARRNPGPDDVGSRKDRWLRWYALPLVMIGAAMVIVGVVDALN